MTLIVNTTAIQAVNNGTDYPRTVMVNGVRVARLKYVRTDGWRGHEEVVPIKKAGWTIHKSSWVAGDYTDAPRDNRASSVEAEIQFLAHKYGAEGRDVLAIFTPTSNVFSSAYEVLVSPIRRAQS